MKYKDTKLIAFLSTFSKQELIEFEKFLHSPYFKQGRDPIPLFEILKKFHPEFSSDKCNEEEIFKELYPALIFTDKKSKDLFRTMSSSLLKAVEEFICNADLKENNILKNRIILKKLLQRNLLKYYEQYLQSSVNELNRIETDSEKDFLENFYLERINTRYYSHILDFKNLFEHSNKSVEFISTYFWLDLIRTAKTNHLSGFRRDLKSNDNIVNRLMEAVNMEQVLKIYVNTPQYVQLCFNYFTYKCLKGDNEKELFEKARKIFFENKSNISRYEKNFYYADLLNIAVSKNDLNYTEYKKEILPLLKCCVEDSAYKISDKDFMQLDFYRNVILYSNFHKEFEWMENFIRIYSDELKPEYRANMKNYSMALLNFGMGDFEKSLENISKVKYDLDHFKIDVKILMLKIYYELKLYEQAISLVETFKHFIKNSKSMHSVIKESYSNFLKYYILILKQNSDTSEVEIRMIRDQLKLEKNLHLRSWLFEILERI